MAQSSSISSSEDEAQDINDYVFDNDDIHRYIRRSRDIVLCFKNHVLQYRHEVPQQV